MLHSRPAAVKSATCDPHRKMAQAPMLERNVLLTMVGVPHHGCCMPMVPEDGARPTPKSFSDHELHKSKKKLRRIRQRPAGNPCPCSNNTMPSLRLTNRPSNSRSLPRNHTAPQWARLWVRLWHNHRLDSGNLSHEPCSTTPSSRQTSRPANSQTHHCNCTDRPASAAKSRWA